MNWLNPRFALLIGFVLLARLLVWRRFQGRSMLFACLNLAAVYWCCFRGGDPSLNLLLAVLFITYVLMVVLQYAALRCWARSPGWLPWIAFFIPVMWLVIIRYVPLTGIVAAVSPSVQEALRRQPAFNVGALFFGISYLAFRTSHLVIEVRNKVVNMPGCWDYLSFAFFLPTIAVGPINPYSQHQLAFTETGRPQIPLGPALLRVLVGGVKYLYLGPLVNQLTYSGLMQDGHPHHWMDLIIAAIAYYLFLYCNFSGFCDIVIGSAGIIGVPVNENFDNPFAARNVKDFWNRWHITLSQYMRDVVFSPLSKLLVRRLGPANANHAIALTILIVFLLVGVWHGVGWNYAAFGAMHAVGVAANHYWGINLKSWLGKDRFLAYNRSRLVSNLATVATFLYVSASLFLFANSFESMKTILSFVEWR